MSILEIIDVGFLRDTLKQSTLKMVRAANTLERLVAQVTLMDETAKALRTRMWGGYLDHVGYLSSTSSIAGIYSEGGVDRYIIIKHILQPLLSDVRRLRLSSQNIDVALSTRASESTLVAVRRTLRPNAGSKVSVDLSTARNNSSLISEWGLSGKGPFYSITVLDTGTGSYTLRFYFTQDRYIDFSSNELVEGWVFECVFTDLRMTNSSQTGVSGPSFFIDWFE